MNLYDTNEYRASDDWPYAISAGCIVYRTTNSQCEVLLLTRNFDHDYYSAGDTNKPSHHLAKGHVRFNETLEAAAIRETKEELGVDVVIEGYLGAIQHTFDHPKFANTTNKVVHYFVARWQADVQKSDNEHDSSVWMTVDAAQKALGKPNPKTEDELIKRFKKYLELT